MGLFRARVVLYQEASTNNLERASLYGCAKRAANACNALLSYAHQDEQWRADLESYLSLLQSQGFITTWHPHQIMPGSEWASTIDLYLDMAGIILLLISSDFLASEYLSPREVQCARQLAEHRQAAVIPVILRPCDWKNAPFARFQSLSRDGRAIIVWENTDAAFSPSKGIIRFPSHGTRKINTSNTEQRWTMGGTTLGVIGR